MYRFEQVMSARIGFLIPLLVYVLVPTTALEAGMCWYYATQPATNTAQPWHTANLEYGCSTTNHLHNAGDLNQVIGETHRNWHCINNEAPNEAYGRAFLAFHRQLILDFDIWRLANTTLGRLEFWDPAPNAMVPGDNEDFASGFTQCSDANTPNPGDNQRQAGALCTTCQSLPNSFIGSNLNNFNSLGEVGYNLEFDWHGSYHVGVGTLGCDDVMGFLYTTRDPAFWMAHKKLDEVARNWQSLQATDVVIVIDRSGSMAANCPGGSADPGESPCAINDARAAALLFADVVLDVRMDGDAVAARQHRIGLVSFASGATSALGLTASNGIRTDNDVDDTPFEIALAGISTSGPTSIAAGIREAIEILESEPDPNPQQVILVLTDGKENTAPCLGGNSPSDCPSANDLTVSEVGDIQIISVGFGAGAEEANLRDISERHGGIFLAEANVSATLSLQKFFITAFGEIYDAAISVDPEGILETGALNSGTFDIEIGDDDRLSAILGFTVETPRADSIWCDVGLEIFTPSGKLVSRSDPGVEAGHGKKYDFIHIDLPYLGESAGTWTGRAARTDSTCESQDYFYSVLVKGLGRIDPFVVRPNIVRGGQILSTFRISESNRPAGGFDNVVASVTVSGPDSAIVGNFPLYDDGTNGDAMAGNNIWSNKIPTPVLEEGAYHLRGHFELTHGGRTRIREAEYSIVVKPEPEQCTNVVGGGIVNAYQQQRVQPGDTVLVAKVACLWNMCSSTDRYEIQISDNMGWLRTIAFDSTDQHQRHDSTDQSGHRWPPLINLPSSFESGHVDAFEGQCFGPGRDDHDNDSYQGNAGGDGYGEDQDNAGGDGHGHGSNPGPPLIAVIPANSKPGDSSIITIIVSSLEHPDQVPIEVTTKIEVATPPDCNGNGLHDYIDIFNGSSRDTDRNRIPDECQGEHSHYSLVGVDDLDEDYTPFEYSLNQNYPNPFNPITTLSYDLPEQSAVILTIYDIAGREVTTIVNASMSPGYHAAVWDGRNDGGQQVPSGIYIVRLVTPGFSKSIKMVLLK